jgi:hypothetical protein
MANIRSFVKIRPIETKSSTGLGFNKIRLSINRLGTATNSIADSFHQTTELIRFENEFLSKSSRTKIEDVEEEGKEKKSLFARATTKLRKKFRRNKRDKQETSSEAEKGSKKGEKDSKKRFEEIKKPFEGFLKGIASLFGNLIMFAITYGALDWLSNKQNAENATKVVKLIWHIGKFAYWLTKNSIGLILDGLTNVIGDFGNEGAIRRSFRFMLGAFQMLGGIAALRTAQYLIMPWKLMKDINLLRTVFGAQAQTQAEVEESTRIRKTGYRDTKTGVIYSEEEYKQMKKSAAKADAKRARKAGKGMSSDLYQGEVDKRFVSQFDGKKKNKLAQRARIGMKRAGKPMKGAFRQIGKFAKANPGKVAGGISVLGGGMRIASGLAMGESAGTAVGAGVGQAAGGIIGGIAGTALLGPFLGPFAPIVGNAIGGFLGEFIGSKIGPIIEPIFEPIGRYFQMLFKVIGGAFGPLFNDFGEMFGALFDFIGQLAKMLFKVADVFFQFHKFVFGLAANTLGKTIGFIVNNVKRLTDPASVGKGIADALTLNLFDFDGENKKAAGGPVEMKSGGALSFGSHPDMLAATGGILLQSVVGGFKNFGFVGSKVQQLMSGDVNKISGILGTKVNSSSGSGSKLGNSLSLDTSTSSTSKVADVGSNLSYKKNVHDAITKGLNGVLLAGIKLFDPEAAKEIEKRVNPGGGGGQTPSNQQPSGAERPPSGPAAPPVSGTKAEKWVQFREYGKIAGAKYPNLVAAQFALESGWGTALSAQHNYFGIKAAEGESATTSNTREVINGQSVYMDEPFKNFASPQDAVNHLVKQWYKDYKGYKGVNNAGDVYAAASMLKSEGYATDPNYAPHLQDLVRSNKQLMAEGGKVIEDVPYLNQRANNSDKYGRPGDTQCYSTTMAMWASQLTGKSLSSEEYNKVRSQYGISTEAYPQKKALADFGIDSVLQTGQSWEDLRKEVRAGYPVPVGFKYKGSGHWGMVVGYKNNGFVVHDPFGQLNMGGAWKKTNSAGDKTNGPGKYYFMDKNLFQNQLPDGDVWMWKAPRSIKPSTKFGDGDDISTTTSEGQVKSASSKSGTGGTAKTADAKPKTVEEMLADFKTGLADALTKFGKVRNASSSPPVPASESETVTKIDASTAPVSGATPVSASNLQQLSAIRDKATKDLTVIADKARRDEEKNQILPIVKIQPVVQKISQPINTGGGSQAIYAKPSQLLTQ